MRPVKKLVMTHPANAGIRRYGESRMRRGFPSFSFPEEVELPYETLGTHPDLVQRLWDELGRVLPEDCRAIFFGGPVLAHPITGIIFGFAGGTHTYALRLPEKERLEAIQAGAKRVWHYADGTLDLSTFGEEWIFCAWYEAEPQWCQAAYNCAGET